MLVDERNELTNSLQIISLDDMRIYSLMTRGTLPSPREDFGMEIFGNKLFIFGGYSETGAMGDFFFLDLDSLLWSEISKEQTLKWPGNRQKTSLKFMNKKLYLIGGVDKKKGNTFNDIWFFDLENMNFQNLINSKFLIGYSSSFIYHNDFYFLNRCNVIGNCQSNVAFLESNIDCPSVCSQNGLCSTSGICNCSFGYFGNDCQNENVCQTDCSSHNFCKLNDLCSKKCSKNQNCDINRNDTLNCPKNCTSLENGICLDNGKCLCNPGYGGLDCSINIGEKETEEVLGLDDEVDKEIQENIKSVKKNFTKQKIPTSYEKITFKMFGYYYFDERKIINQNINLNKYDNLNNCPQECNSRGFCKDKQCFCRPGYVGQSCEVSTVNLEHVKSEFITFRNKMIIYCCVALIFGIQFGLFSLKYVKDK